MQTSLFLTFLSKWMNKNENLLKSFCLLAQGFFSRTFFMVYSVIESILTILSKGFTKKLKAWKENFCAWKVLEFCEENEARVLIYLPLHVWAHCVLIAAFVEQRPSFRNLMQLALGKISPDERFAKNIHIYQKSVALTFWNAPQGNGNETNRGC